MIISTYKTECKTQSFDQGHIADKWLVKSHYKQMQKPRAWAIVVKLMSQIFSLLSKSLGTLSGHLASLSLESPS